MRKVYLILATAAGMTFTSCTNSEYIGEAGTLQKANGNEIVIGGGAGKMSRAEGAAAAALLGDAMKVYGVKNIGSTNYGKVFVNYQVLYNTAQSGNAEYNDGWYYAGAVSGQDIKYWDYSASDYHFAAGSPVANFTYALDATTGDIKTATVTGLGGRLIRTIGVASDNSPVYVADPVVASKATDYNQEVNFTFRALQAKVRVGIYETIPGYKITDIKFYNNAEPAVARDYITLNSATNNYFQGGSDVTGVVTYNWATPTYTFEYTTGLQARKFWEGGQFTDGVPAISSTGDIADLYGAEAQMDDATGYFIVMPTPSETDATDLTIKCDYELTSLDGSGETINVTGATATIPAAYTKWYANTVYTYLFKISDNTNGSTGDPSTDPAGLYPITFDAVVVDFEDNKVGTETTVSTPSITCSQNGDVSGNGIVFVAGTNITINVSEESDIEVKRLSGDFDYTKSYDAQDYDDASATFSNVTTATITGVVAKTYVIKATSTADATKVAYFVLVVGDAETGQANS